MGEHIYCHPLTDCFIVSQFFCVARHVGYLKLELKPAQIYVIYIYIYIYVCVYVFGQHFFIETYLIKQYKHFFALILPSAVYCNGIMKRHNTLQKYISLFISLVRVESGISLREIGKGRQTEDCYINLFSTHNLLTTLCFHVQGLMSSLMRSLQPRVAVSHSSPGHLLATHWHSPDLLTAWSCIWD